MITDHKSLGSQPPERNTIDPESVAQENVTLICSNSLGASTTAAVDDFVDPSQGKPRRRRGPYPWENTARLAREYKHIRGQLIRLHEQLLDAIRAKHGSISIMHAKLAVDVVRHEAIARICESRLAKDPDCSIADLNSLLTRIATATDTSTRALARLDLEQDAQAALIARLYGTKRKAPK